ncbi:RHS repeat-associated core domain-containing protein [Pirellulaceae bacterium SH449]
MNADGVGLDSSGGVTVPKLGTRGTGTFSVSLSSAIAKLAQTTANGGAGITFSATAPGRATVVINSEDEISFSIADAAGRTVMSGKLNNVGQLASLTDAESQTTSYTYNARGNKLTETYPDHTGGSPGDSTYGIVTFVYDNAGRVLRKQDQLGDTVTYLYDLAGRMTQRDYRTRVNSPSGTIADSYTFTFDRASRMLTAVNGRYSNTVTYTYDPIGRKATESLAIASRTYTTTSEYNSRGELTKVTYPDSSISERTYHDTGALHLLKLDGSTISTRTYDDGRRLTGETLGNGVTETRTYSTDNLLTGISYGGTGTAIGNLSYTWDANKNKTSETIGGTMSGYGFTSAGTSYDDEDRLTGYARASGTFTQAWNLTPVGDWNSITTNGTAQNRTHGPTHELLTAAGQNITTDVKGNITVLPANLTPQASPLGLQWDFDNKLKAADLGNNSSVDVEFQYDALGRRVARLGSSGSFVFVQHDQQTIADYGYGDAPSSPLYRYVYASYIDEPVVRKAAGTGGTIHYYHRNQQYSITAMTTSTGAVAERYAYTAYGQPTILSASGTVLTNSAVGNRYTYTGREWDETLGLHHFRARWMSPLAGRFLGRDPIGYEGGILLYFAYFSISRTDPLGLNDIIVDSGSVGDDAISFPPRSKEWPCEDGWYIHSTNTDILENTSSSSITGSTSISGRYVSIFRRVTHSDWEVVAESHTGGCGDPLSLSLGTTKYHENSTGNEVGIGVGVSGRFRGIEITVSGQRSWSWGETHGNGSFMESTLGPFQKKCRAFKVKILAWKTTERFLHWRARLDQANWTIVQDTTTFRYGDTIGHTVCAKECVERSDPNE